MCGITGMFNYASGAPATVPALRKLNDCIIHRGPDDEGYHTSGPCGLAMRRLSIIDLSTGHQPISNEDGSVWIVFNGEIYNFQELRERMLARGHSFRTKSDTEAIVHLYEEYGRDCVKELRGMFAFAIWDGRKKTLLLARDRIGKKPLNYCVTRDGIAFSSELRALLQVDGFSKDTDYEALDMFLSLQYIPSPLTIYKQAKKLPPAHTLWVENGKIDIAPYWDLPLGAGPLDISLGEAKERIAAELKEAVRLRMISDVPLGAFLSGGIDSSVIVALMSELSDKPVRTFAIGFEEREFSELHYAREVAARYGCSHTEFIVKAEMADILPKLAWHYSEPYADPSALPSYYVARETRKHVTVALNGDGGDENFAGYLRYVAIKLAHYWDYLPMPVRKAIAAGAEYLPDRNAPFSTIWRGKRFLRSTVTADFPSRHLKVIGYFNADDKKTLYTEAFKQALGDRQNMANRYMAEKYAAAAGEDFIAQMLYVDIKTYLPECLMAKIDIATMANSLEGRSPLLDHKFMELCFRLRGDWKLRGLHGTKWILKETFRDKLPDRIRRRGKMGFGIPLGPWFRGRLKDYWEGHCLSETALARGYFEPKALRRLWDDHQSGKCDNGHCLWALLMLELWHGQFANDDKLN